MKLQAVMLYALDLIQRQGLQAKRLFAHAGFGLWR